jgi:hypothetical protein
MKQVVYIPVMVPESSNLYPMSLLRNTLATVNGVNLNASNEPFI